MVNKEDSNSYPYRKISETFLDFALPLLEIAGGEATKEQIEDILKIAFTVWNSVVFDAVNCNNDCIAEVRQLMSIHPGTSSIIEMMITRKQTMFADDLRLIGEYKLTKKDGERNLWAEARDPKTKDE